MDAARTRNRRRPRRGTLTIPALATLLVLSGCGTRIPHEDVLAATAPREVSLSAETIQRLRQPNDSTSASRPSRTSGPAEPAPKSSPPRASYANAETKNGAAPPALAAATSSTSALPPPQTKAKSSPAARPCAGNEAPVPVGQVGTFSGVGGAVTVSARSTLAAWVASVNDGGGIRCHPLRLYTVDDGGDPAKAAAAIGELVRHRGVVALLGNITTLTIGGFRSTVESLKVPAIGGELISPDWNQSPYMFPTGAGIDSQLAGMIRGGVLEGKKRLGLAYCVEASVCTYTKRTIEGGLAARAGAQLAYSSPVSLTQTDFTAQCLNAKNAGVDLLALAVDGASMTRIARSCEAIGYRPLLAAVATTLSSANGRDPGLRAFGVVSSTGLAPWINDDVPGLRRYRETLHRYAPNIQPDAISLLAWSSGTLFEAAMERLDANETTTRIDAGGVLTGLGRIRNETLGGLTTRLSFQPDQPHPTSGCVYLTRLSRSGWAAPLGSRPTCL